MKIECTPQEFRQLVSLFGPQEILPEGVQISSGQPNPDAIPRIQVYAPPEKMDAAVENLDTEHPVDRIPMTEQKGLKDVVQQKLNEVSQPAGLQQDLTSCVRDEVKRRQAAERNADQAPEQPAAEPAAPQATEETSKFEAPQAAAETPTEAEQKAENGKRIRELIIRASTISSPTEAVEVVKTAGSVESVKDLKPEQAPAVIAALQDFIANQGGKA